MLFELIVFGGVFFWILVAIASLIILINTGTENETGAIATFLASLVIFYGLSKPPIPDWRWPVAYLVIGLVWWFFVFNIRLMKLKKYLKDNPKFVEDGKIKTYGMVEEMRLIYENEPSFEKFFGRTLCWPMNIVKFFFFDFIQMIYDNLVAFFISYKKRMLGIR